MSVDLDLLEKLMKLNEKSPSLYHLNLNDEDFPLSDVSITHTPTPVNEPTTRGGVYFSDKFAYKMKGTINDLSVVSSLTKKMLGPNTEFGELKINAKIDSENDGVKNFKISTNLTNSVQSPTSIELSMIIVNLEEI